MALSLAAGEAETLSGRKTTRSLQQITKPFLHTKIAFK
jgi:hypothetical protein